MGRLLALMNVTKTGRGARMSANARHAHGILLAVLAVLVAGCGTAALLPRGAASAGLPSLPPDTRLVPVPHLSPARPPYLAAIADAAFGSTVIRVSDQHAFGTSSLQLRHAHAKRQPWNADGSRLLLGYSASGFLLDGRTYTYSGQQLPNAGAGVWSSVDPDAFFTVVGNRLLRRSPTTGVETVVHVFSDWTDVTIGAGENDPSNDDRSLALVARSSTRTSVLVYDLRSNVVAGSADLPAQAGARIDWVAASQSGRFVVINWLADGATPGTGVDLYTRDMTFVRHLYDVSEEADLGYDTAGREVYVTFDGPDGKSHGDRETLMAVPLVEGAPTRVLRTDWVGTFVSCRNVARPGWCYVSDSTADASKSHAAGYDEIFAVKLDGTETVERFAHAQQSAAVSYDWSALAVPSRDGTRVLWGSDWRLGPAAPAYAYVASYGSPIGNFANEH
jgi:hypothetical protein